MLYGSGIYIVSKDDMASFLEEVKQQYKDIDWFFARGIYLLGILTNEILIN